MAYVTRVPGTVIAAASHNAEYRDQVVSVFATIAARDAAITVPVRGMMAYCTVPGRMFLRGASVWYEAGVADAVANVRRYQASRAAVQNIATNYTTPSTATVSWDTEQVDTDNMAAVPWTSITLTEGIWVSSGYLRVTLTASVTVQASIPATGNTPYVQLLLGASVVHAQGLGHLTANNATASLFTFANLSSMFVVPNAGTTLQVQVVVPTAWTAGTPAMAANLDASLTMLKVG